MKNKILTLFSVSALAAVVLAAPLSSGLKPGEFVTPFHPKHLSGPDKGTDTCPPCKYGNLPAVQVWLNKEDAKTASAITEAVNEEVTKSAKNLKGFVLHVTKDKAAKAAAKTAAQNAEAAGLVNVAVATVEPTNEAIANYKINLKPEIRNTIIVYRKMKIVATMVNLKRTPEDLGRLRQALAVAQK